MSEYAFGTVSWLELAAILALAIILSIIISSKQKPVVETYKERLAKAKEIVDYYINNNVELMNEWKAARESKDKNKEALTFYKIMNLVNEKFIEYNLICYDMICIVLDDGVYIKYIDHIEDLIRKHDKKKK